MQAFCTLKIQPKLPFSLNVKAALKSWHHEDFEATLTFGWFGDAFFVVSTQKLAILPDPISTFWYCWKLKGCLLPHHNNTTTLNNQHEPPPLYPPCNVALSLHWKVSGAPNTWRCSYQSTYARHWRRLCTQHNWFPCLGHQTETHQKIGRW